MSRECLGNVFLISPQLFLAIYRLVKDVRGIWGMFSEFLWQKMKKLRFLFIQRIILFYNKEFRFLFPEFPEAQEFSDIQAFEHGECPGNLGNLGNICNAISKSEKRAGYYACSSVVLV